MPADPASLIRKYIRSPEASWSLGVDGAIAEFMFDCDETLTVEEQTDSICAATTRGAIAINRLSSLRCHAWQQRRSHGNGETRVLGFSYSSDTLRTDSHQVITALGPDHAAIHAGNRTLELFDLGLGSTQIQFCVRSGDTGLVEALHAHTGRHLFDCGPGLMHQLHRQSPHRVVLSALARLEVYGSIPAAEDHTGAGPHTHLLPDLLGKDHHDDEYVLRLYPPHPAHDKYGTPVTYIQAHEDAFQELLQRFGREKTA